MGIATPGQRRPSSLPAGLHVYRRQLQGGKTRLHLRADEQGQAQLLINANRVVHLNPTAAQMAWMILEEVDERRAIQWLQKRFRIPRRTLRADYQQIKLQLDELARPDGACPIHELQLEVVAPFSQTPAAPYRMDLALTYRCNCSCAHCYNARPRSFPELDTASWRQILDRLWEVGVPHICFTGGEATLRQDLPELIAHAERLGQITGLLSNGRRLAQPGYVESLVEAGLDHIQITLESHDAAIHDQMVQSPGAWQQTVRGIEQAVASGLYVMTNTTLLEENAPLIEETIDFLAGLGVPTVGCNALIYAGSGKVVGTGLAESELPALLDGVRARTDSHGQQLIWYTPTQYCHFDPVQMELGVKGCTAALYNMCVEPDGKVIPCQSYYQPLGSLLSDPWDSIWNADLARWLRQRQYVPSKCEGCAVLAECGGGCPLSLDHQQPAGLIELPMLAEGRNP